MPNIRLNAPARQPSIEPAPAIVNPTDTGWIPISRKLAKILPQARGAEVKLLLAFNTLTHGFTRQAYPITHSRLAERAGIGRATVQRALYSMRERGWVTWETLYKPNQIPRPLPANWGAKRAAENERRREAGLPDLPPLPRLEYQPCKFVFLIPGLKCNIKSNLDDGVASKRCDGGIKTMQIVRRSFKEKKRSSAREAQQQRAGEPLLRTENASTEPDSRTVTLTAAPELAAMAAPAQTSAPAAAPIQDPETIRLVVEALTRRMVPGTTITEATAKKALAIATKHKGDHRHIVHWVDTRTGQRLRSITKMLEYLEEHMPKTVVDCSAITARLAPTETPAQAAQRVAREHLRNTIQDQQGADWAGACPTCRGDGKTDAGYCACKAGQSAREIEERTAAVVADLRYAIAARVTVLTPDGQFTDVPATEAAIKAVDACPACQGNGKMGAGYCGCRAGKLAMAIERERTTTASIRSAIHTPIFRGVRFDEEATKTLWAELDSCPTCHGNGTTDTGYCACKAGQIARKILEPTLASAAA